MNNQFSMLIVDDDEDITRSLSLIFERQGFTVATAANGEAALSIARQGPLALALLDIKLPDTEGTELIAPLRELHPDLMVIMATGNATLRTAIRALNEGAAAYITKPVDLDDLRAKIAQVLEKRRLIVENRQLYRDIKHELKERRKSQAELELALVELKRSNRDLEQFAFVASHDLQEPLRMVSSFVQLLAQRYHDQLDTDADEFINYAVEGANRMQKLINDLLLFSRVRTTQHPFETVDLNAVLRVVLLNLKLRVQESKAHITHDPLPVLKGDKSQLVQLFQNLLDNSLQFSKRKPLEIHIGAARVDREWILSVRDNGPGIKPRYHERIFVIFQSMRSKETSSHSGIGLSIAKRIVEHHGGRIWVESEPGKGATFLFTIPAEGGAA